MFSPSAKIRIRTVGFGPGMVSNSVQRLVNERAVQAAGASVGSEGDRRGVGDEGG